MGRFLHEAMSSCHVVLELFAFYQGQSQPVIHKYTGSSELNSTSLEPFILMQLFSMYHYYFSPPESNTLCPVMYPVRQIIVTMFAVSCGVPSRPTGMFLTSPGVPTKNSALGIMPVSPIIAGATLLTVIPSFASFSARLRIIPSRPAFEAA